MSDDASQTTLNASTRPIEHALARLDLIDVAAWCAFERARTIRLPSCPSIELAQALIQRLEWKGVLRVGGHGERSGLPMRAIYDPLTWSYGDLDPSETLEPILLEQLHRLSSTTESSLLKLALWKELATAELSGYLRHLLERQWMSGAWAVDLLRSIAAELDVLPLGKRRYVIWAGVREGSAAFLRSAGDPHTVYESMLVDMRRRARWIAGDQSRDIGFVPAQGWRRSILLSLFVDEITSLGEQYWQMIPSLKAIETFAHKVNR